MNTDCIITVKVSLKGRQDDEHKHRRLANMARGPGWELNTLLDRGISRARIVHFFCAAFARICRLRKSAQYCLAILQGGEMTVSANLRNSPQNFQHCCHACFNGLSLPRMPYMLPHHAIRVATFCHEHRLGEICGTSVTITFVRTPSGSCQKAVARGTAIV